MCWVRLRRHFILYCTNSQHPWLLRRHCSKSPSKSVFFCSSCQILKSWPLAYSSNDGSSNDDQTTLFMCVCACDCVCVSTMPLQQRTSKIKPEIRQWYRLVTDSNGVPSVREDYAWLSVLAKWEWEDRVVVGREVEGSAGHVLGWSFNLNVGQRKWAQGFMKTFLSVSLCAFFCHSYCAL